MQFGHLEEAGGTITKIDWTDLKLSDFEKEDTIPINYKIAFTGFYSDVSDVVDIQIARRHAMHRARCIICCWGHNVA